MLTAGFTALRSEIPQHCQRSGTRRPKTAGIFAVFSKDKPGAGLALIVGEQRHVPSSSRFDRADTDVRAKRHLIVPRVVPTARARQQHLRAPTSKHVPQRDWKRELHPDRGNNPIRSRRRTAGIVCFGCAAHRCYCTVPPAASDLSRCANECSPAGDTARRTSSGSSPPNLTTRRTSPRDCSLNPLLPERHLRV